MEDIIFYSLHNELKPLKKNLKIFVDTPTGVGEKSYDHSKLSRVLEQIGSRKVKNKHVVRKTVNKS